MKLFSERHGFTKRREALQLNSMDERLRIALYNYFYEKFTQEWGNVFLGEYGRGYHIARRLWTDLWYQTPDNFPNQVRFLEVLKRTLMNIEWYRVYDLIEFLTMLDFVDPDAVNSILEKEMSGYRVAKGFVVPITDESELEELKTTASLPDPFAGARMHINSALEKLAQRPEPDLRNAVKEAISAVESAARIITGTGRKKATLGDLLKVLEEQGLHSALREAWSKLYGYTSNEHGVRHAMIEEPAIDFALAKYLVVACAAFVNFLCMRFAQQNNKDYNRS